METKPKCQHDFVHMGLCVVGMGRELAPMSCSLAPDPVLLVFAFSVIAFSTLLGEHRTCPVLHGADPLVTSMHL